MLKDLMVSHATIVSDKCHFIKPNTSDVTTVQILVLGQVTAVPTMQVMIQLLSAEFIPTKISSMWNILCHFDR